MPPSAANPNVAIDATAETLQRSVPVVNADSPPFILLFIIGVFLAYGGWAIYRRPRR